MKFAAIDIGNTTAKATILNGHAVTEVFRGGSATEALEWASIRSPQGLAYCTTRDLPEEERHALTEAGAWEFTARSPVPLAVDYASRDTLGADRLASAVGAAFRFPGSNILVADAGTALTLDFVEAAGRFIGGNISPGLAMRFAALNRFTSRLPLVEPQAPEESPVLGDRRGHYLGVDTASAIRCGVRWGMAGEIAAVFSLAERDYGKVLLLLTGGDGLRLMPDVQRLLGGETTVCYEADLLALGLNIGYEFNHDNEI